MVVSNLSARRSVERAAFTARASFRLEILHHTHIGHYKDWKLPSFDIT